MNTTVAAASSLAPIPPASAVGRSMAQLALYSDIMARRYGLPAQYTRNASRTEHMPPFLGNCLDMAGTRKGARDG